MRILRLAPWILGAAFAARPCPVGAEPPAPRLRGSVREADGAPSSGRVVVTPTQPAGAARTISLGEGGRFAVDVPARATVTVEAVDGSGCALRVNGVGLPRATPLDLVWPADLVTLRGTVVDPARAPVAGAVVRSWSDVAFGVLVDASTTTAADGTFALRVHADGHLRVEAAGYEVAPARVPAADVPLVVRLRREGRLRGVVRTVEGAIVAGTTVWARRTGARFVDTTGDRPEPPVSLGTTDAEGRFGPAPLPRGAWLVFALGAGVVSREVAASPGVPAGVRVDADLPLDREVSLLTVPAATLSGVVVNDAGRGVGGASVVAGAPPPRKPGVFEFPSADELAGPAAVTDAEGRFTLDGLVPGRAVTLVAGREGVAGPSSASLVPTLAPSSRPSLRVPTLDRLDVRVVDAGGAPIPQAAVWAAAGQGWRMATTGDDGRALLDGVPVGDVRVQVRPFGAVALTSATLAVVPGAGAGTPLEVRVETGASLVGVLRFADGRRRTNVGVSVRGPVRPSHRLGGADLEGAVRLDGTFVVAGLEPGRYELSAATAWGKRQWTGVQEVETGASDVVLTLAPTPRDEREAPPFEVLVVGPDGAPVPYAVGQASVEGRGIRTFEVEQGLAILDGDGPTVDLRVRGARDAHGLPLPWGPRELKAVKVGAGSVTLTLPAERRIEGRVVGHDGRGLEGVEVRAQAPGPDAYTAFDALDAPADVTATDATGAFVLRQLDDRAYDVEVPRASGFLPAAERAVRAGASGVVILRRHSIDAVVTVVDVRGRPVVGATVRWSEVELPGGDDDAPSPPVLPWAYVPAEAHTDGNGRARCVELDPERLFTLDAVPPHTRGDVLATRRDGWRPADVTLTLPPGASIAGVVRSKEGVPIPWAQVEARKDGEHLGMDEVDGEGRFSIDGLPPGPIEVRATLLGVAGAGDDDVRATVETGTQDLVLVADPGPTLVIRAEGRSFPGTPDRARIGGGWTEARLYDQGPDGAVTAVSYGHVEHGALVFRRLRPGQPYTLWIPWTPEAGGTFFEQGAALVVGERTVILDPGAPISGTVDLTRVHSPAPSNIGRGRSDTVLVRRGPVLLHRRLEDGGDFAFPPLPAGTWTLRAHVRDVDRGDLEASSEVEAGSRVLLTPAATTAR